MKKIVTKPFDRNKIPPRQNALFMPFLWAWAYVITSRAKLSIKKVRMKGLKPPFLVLGTHHAFMDFYVTPRALFPYRANYISELEGFEAYGEWLYRQVGCLGTRKFVDDMALIKNIKRVLNRGDILVMYPEARYANVGTSSTLQPSVAKLAKMLKVPVVVINMKGNYLQSPIWNLKKRKEVKLEATITQVFTKEELADATLEEVYGRLSKELTYDEYAWQYEKKMSVTYKKRAEGLEKVLYKCPKCKKEFNMIAQGAKLFCTQCTTAWEMNEYGKMVSCEHGTSNEPMVSCENGTFNKPMQIKSIEGRIHIPDWYEWQRQETIKEIEENRYCLECEVKIESLPNAVNFIDCSIGKLKHSKEGFYLTFRDYGESEEKTMFFSSKTMWSVHTEYDYRKKGQCITLSTLDNTYFLFPLEEGFNATKIQFATEYFYTL